MKTIKISIKCIFLILLLITACTMENDNIQIEDIKKEISKTEKDFAEMAKNKGVAEAFLNFAAEDAVLNRNNTLIKGKEAIKIYFENQTLKNVQLDWEPDFTEVAKSGDLGYTYGHYTFSAIDAGGEKITNSGIFHTVWKRQADGSWRFVWD